MAETFDKSKAELFGELYLDEHGQPHFICHIRGEDYGKARDGIEKFIALLQEQIKNERQCPFYRDDDHTLCERNH
jgi:hypothetical protein